MKERGYIAELRSDGTVKAIYVRMGGFENLEKYHNTQTDVDKLMSYEEYINIGDNVFMPDDQSDMDHTYYCNNTKQRDAIIFKNELDFGRRIRKEPFIDIVFLWKIGCWCELK